jgi:hypothetical protein
MRSILCQKDRIVSPEYSRRVAADRLGVDPIELPGGHSPMASRLQELAQALLADRYGRRERPTTQAAPLLQAPATDFSPKRSLSSRGRASPRAP